MAGYRSSDRRRNYFFTGGQTILVELCSPGYRSAHPGHVRYYKILATIPADQAFGPPDPACTMVKK